MFEDRADAGRKLAERLAGLQLAGKLMLGARPIVLGLPRGGLPVARLVADRLGAELDVCLVRKLGVPWQPELAFGAIAEGGCQVLDEALVRQCKLRPEEIAEMAAAARQEIERRARLYRPGHPPPDVHGRVAVIVDDGVATGSTMLAAIRTLRHQGAERIVVAVPLAARESLVLLRGEADQVVCLDTPEPFYSVGTWYEDFTQVGDEQVRNILQSSLRLKE